MNKLVSHTLYLLSKIRKYITETACINIYKTMVLSLIQYYGNLSNLDFYRGLRICINDRVHLIKQELISNCKVAPLKDRRLSHLLIFMNKEKTNNCLLKTSQMQTRLHTAPV